MSMYSTWLYSDLNTAVAVAYGLLHLCSAYVLAKMHNQYLQSHLMLTNICIHLLLHTLANNQLAGLLCTLHSCHIYTLLYTYAIAAHSLVLAGSQALVPAGSAKTLLTAIGTHTGSLSHILIWYCRNFLYTIGMCHILYAYLCYVWLL